MMTVKLVEPSDKYQKSFIEALHEGHVRGIGNPMSEKAIDFIDSDFTDYLKTLYNCGGTIECPDGIVRDRVPSNEYWLVLDDCFIGAISLRHYLNDFLEQFGGHIGYGVRPGFRKQGYGKLMLKLCLEEAKNLESKLGLKRLLLTCEEGNMGSRRIIEANGGSFDSTVTYSWTTKKERLYWIDL